MLKLSVLRRIVMFTIVLLFICQFFHINLLIGGLTGSVLVFYVKLLDVYAYLESLISSKYFTINTLISVLPVVVLYAIFGRAFCGWVCPMDFIFSLVDKIKRGHRRELNLSHRVGYLVVITFLFLSAILEIPVFTNYFSHITNFFRAISSSVYMALDVPANPSILYFSVSML
ncbi:MAG: 4Fe-4S binding protein, partial [Nitrospirae bacterium]